MKLPEECLRSCLSVCRTFNDEDQHGLTLLLVAVAGVLGFVAGRIDWKYLVTTLERIWKESEISISQLQFNRNGRCKHSSLLRRTTSLEKAKKKQNCRVDNKESPQISPQSVSSNSSSGSLKLKGSLSPLLLGSRRASSLPSLETSPRTEMEGETSIEDAKSMKKVKSMTVCIPRSATTSEAGSPKQSPCTKNGTVCSSYSVSLQHHSLLSGDETLPAAAWICGRDAMSLDHLDCGLGWLDLIEPSLDDVYGEEWEKNVSSDDLPHCKDVISFALSVKGPFQMEYRLKVAQDHCRWVLDIGKPRYAPGGGEFVGFVGWRIDIHERKTIENNYWKYWLLPHEFLVNWGNDGVHFDNVSPAFPSFLGYKMEEFKAKPWVDFLHPDDVPSTMEAFHKLREGKAMFRLVNRFRCKEGKVDGPAYVDSNGTFKWLNWTASDMFAASRDITAEKLAQEELQQSQKELRRITDVIPGGVFVYRIDASGNESFPYMSKGALRMSLDAPKDDSKAGRKVFGLQVHPEDTHRLKGEMNHVVLTQTPLDHDFRFIKDGEVRWVRVHAVSRVDSSGTEWSGVAWDITEQHQVVDALKEARDVAEKAAQAKGKFLAHMSHEIRTPMNAVIGMGALLVETDLTDEQREYASTIRSSGEALLGIINDILDYSKIEAGKMELELRPMDILQCIEESFDLVVPQASLKNLELTYNVSDFIPSVVIGDMNRIRQILVNLLSNAVKFTEHGFVCINVGGRRIDDLQSAKLPAKFADSALGKSMYKMSKRIWEIEFSVKDSGIGIPEDRKNSLFQAFMQVDASTTRRYGGTGLGLAICARLSTLHGGRIWVESFAGEGSIFHFTIIAEEVPTASRALGYEDEFENIPSLQNKRILIVAGSSSSTQTMCARLLKSWRMRPVCANSSQEALILLRRMIESSSSSRISPAHDRISPAFDAVIFDCSLLDTEDPQVMECLSLCSTSLQTVPSLLLTPFGRRNQEYYCGEQLVHFDGYVSKPVKESHLLNALVNLLVQVQDDDHRHSSRPSPVQTRRQSKRPGGTPTTPDTPNKLSDIGKLYKLRILIAEDNLINQKVMMKLLLRLGYTADVVGNGREALEAVLRQTYDVCLMDCFMPEMDGLEASRKIIECANPAPVLVAVTAAALEEEMQACLEAGMQMYISKPIQADELMDTLAKCWQMKQGFD